jgi:hypothetical protein
MKRDIHLAGFLVAADDWDHLETGLRLQLVSAAHPAIAAAAAAMIAPSGRASPSAPEAHPPYEAYELVESVG